MKSALQINKEYSEKYVQKIKEATIPTMIRFLIAKKEIKNIADLGCGDGGTIIAISKKYKNKKITGIDISPRRIRELKQKFPWYNFVCRDVCFTKLKPDSFDLVICSQVIEHVEDDKKLAKEIRKILKQKGYLYISSVIKKPWAVYKYKNKYCKFVLDPTHEYEYKSEKEFLNLLRNNDFKICKSRVFITKRRFMGFTIPIPGFYIIEVLCQK